MIGTLDAPTLAPAPGGGAVEAAVAGLTALLAGGGTPSRAVLRDLALMGRTLVAAGDPSGQEIIDLAATLERVRSVVGSNGGAGGAVQRLREAAGMVQVGSGAGKRRHAKRPQAELDAIRDALTALRAKRATVRGSDEWFAARHVEAVAAGKIRIEPAPKRRPSIDVPPAGPARTHHRGFAAGMLLGRERPEVGKVRGEYGGWGRYSPGADHAARRSCDGIDISAELEARARRRATSEDGLDPKPRNRKRMGGRSDRRNLRPGGQTRVRQVDRARRLQAEWNRGVFNATRGERLMNTAPTRRQVENMIAQALAAGVTMSEADQAAMLAAAR